MNVSLLRILSVKVELITTLLGFNHSTTIPDESQCNEIGPHGVVQVNTDWSISAARLVDIAHSNNQLASCYNVHIK